MKGLSLKLSTSFNILLILFSCKSSNFLFSNFLLDVLLALNILLSISNKENIYNINI